jgi:hypothetical protein
MKNLESFNGFEIISESKMSRLTGGKLTATGKGGYAGTSSKCSRRWTTDENDSETGNNRGTSGTQADCNGGDWSVVSISIGSTSFS